jgi:3-oxoacyl-[acyl-carrier protein] reductase
VLIVARDHLALDETVNVICGRGQTAHGRTCDLSQPGSVETLLQHIAETLGTIDIVLLNGGGPPPLSALARDLPMWREQFETMVLRQIEITQYLLGDMRQQRWGRILAVSSTSVREPIPGLVISNALRCALAGWVKTLATEVAADGITVNLLMPGRFATERTSRLDALEAAALGIDASAVAAESQKGIPARRYGAPAEFGAAAAFLASQQAAYITGAAIPIDGGLLRTIL